MKIIRNINKIFLSFFVILMLSTSMSIASEGVDVALPELKQTYREQIDKEIKQNQTGKADEIVEKILDKIPVDTVERRPLMDVVFKMFKSLLAVVVLVLVIAGIIKLFMALKNKVSEDEVEALKSEPSSISEAVSSFVKNNLD